MNKITYPKTLAEYKQLKKFYSSGNLTPEETILAESIITRWRQVKGSIALELLVKMSGKTTNVVARELGVKPRQLYEMINGCNSLNSNMPVLCKYFNVKEELFNYEGQIRKKSKSK